MVNALSKEVNVMTKERYHQALERVNPSLTYRECLSLLEPIQQKGAVTELLKPWLDDHCFSAVIKVSKKSAIEALAWYWHREVQGTEEANKAMDYWMRVNGIDILLMEQERLFEEYLNNQTIGDKSIRAYINAVSAGGSLTVKLQEKHFLAGGESLLITKTETVQKVADGLTNGELNDLPHDLKSALNHFLKWKCVTEHTVVARERVTEVGVSVPSHGVRFLRVLQLYRSGLNQNALEAYDHLIKALSNGTFRYEGKSGIHTEHTSSFKSFHRYRPYAISTFFIFCDGTMGFGPALLGSFVSASSGYAPIYFISSFITLLALPIAFFALKR